jgi:hypothetical protein
MELRRDLQDFRKVSVDNDHANTKHREPKESDTPVSDADVPAPGEAVEMPAEAVDATV